MAGKKSAILAIRIVSDAKDAKKGFDQTSDAAGRWQQNMKRAAIGAGLAMAGFVAKVALDFQAVRRTLNVGTGATGEALEGLTDVVKGIATQVPVAFDVMADAVATLNTLTGATGEELERLGVQVLNAARLLEEDGAGAAEAFGKALKQWQIDAKDGAEMMDYLYKLTQDYGVGLTELSTDLTTYGGTLKNAGLEMHETADLFARLSSEGLEVSKVMPSLSRAFLKWAEDGKDVKTELSNIVDEIYNAKDGTEALAIAGDVFGARGSQSMVTAIRNGTFALEDLGDGLADASGALDEASEHNRTFGESFTLLKNTAMVAIEPIATEILNFLLPPLTTMAEIVADNSTAFGILFGVVGAFLTVILAAQGGMMAYHGALVAIKIATEAWAIAQWALDAAMAANPIAIVIIGVIALIALFVTMYLKVEWFRNAVDTAFSFAVTAFSWLLGPLGTIIQMLKWAWNHVSELGTAFTVAGGVARVALSWIQGWIDKIVGAVQTLIGWIGRIRFPSPPSWMSKLGGGGASAAGARGLAAYSLDARSGPELLQAGLFQSREPLAPRVAPTMMDALSGAGRGQWAPVQEVTNYNYSVNVDGSGIVDPHAVADQVRRVLADTDRSRGSRPAASMARMAGPRVF